MSSLGDVAPENASDLDVVKEIAEVVLLLGDALERRDDETNLRRTVARATLTFGIALGRIEQLQRSLDALYGAPFSDRVYAALRDRLARAEGYRLVPTRLVPGAVVLNGHPWRVFELAEPVAPVAELLAPLVVGEIGGDRFARITVSLGFTDSFMPEAVCRINDERHVYLRGPRAVMAEKDWRCPVLAIVQKEKE